VARVDVVILPRVGALRTFRTERGDRIAVLALRSGRRQLFVQHPHDPDQRQLVAELSADDSQVLVELLGGPLLELQVSSAADVVTVLDWVRISSDSAADGAAIGDLRLRSRTGATILAVMRDDNVHADPRPEFLLQEGDVVVISGSTEDLTKGRHQLTEPRA
jgi:TrkA domain protein